MNKIRSKSIFLLINISNSEIKQDMFVKHVCPLSAANLSCDQVIMHDF
jgi:hypothetical protein